MIFAYLALALGVAVPFAPEPVQVPMLAAVAVCGVLYVRAMNRRARRDVQ